MKWIACLVIMVGCQRGDAGAPSKELPATGAAGPDYTSDIDALCNSVQRSGADKIEPEARSLTIANWLAANMKTDASHQFLVKIQPLGGDAKADALEGEAKRVGLAGCALAAEWRTPK